MCKVHEGFVLDGLPYARLIVEVCSQRYQVRKHHADQRQLDQTY